MIPALVLSPHKENLHLLQSKIKEICPQLDLCQWGNSEKTLLDFKDNLTAKIAFVNAELFLQKHSKIRTEIERLGIETILMSDSIELAVKAFKHKVCGFLPKPFCPDLLKEAVALAKQRLMEKEQKAYSKIPETQIPQEQSQLIAIPTIEGYEFFLPAQIIRCEGYQNCTRIITKEKKDIVSSYNIGVFRKKLEQKNFFAPHKSHLINLIHVRKYNKEGTIQMSDTSSVPVAKRRKSAFLNLMVLAR